MQIGRKLLEVIEAVLSAAETERADAALREHLRTAPLSPQEKSQVTHLVFSYFRWVGWNDRAKPLRAQLEVVNELVENFAANPDAFTAGELLQRAVPGWLREVMPVSPELVRSFQEPPKLWLRARPGRGADVAKELGESAVHPIVADAVEYWGGQDLFLTKLFHSGSFEMQDLSSQCVGLACAPVTGQTWWDACAGEGGKTLHLCDLMQNKGLVWASDPAEWRLARLKRRASRAGLFNYRAKRWIHKDQLPMKTKFDGILVDAPCSGVGTWGRNPHARWSTTKNDVLELGALQKSLLDLVSTSVKPGGKLIYAVCTLTVPETVDVAKAFSSSHLDFEPVEMSHPLAPGKTSAQLTLLPWEARANGMYIAAWKRKH